MNRVSRVEAAKKFWSNVSSNSLIHHEVTSTRYRAVYIPRCHHVTSGIVEGGMNYFQSVEVRVVIPEDVTIWKRTMVRIFGESIFSYVGLSLCIEIITVLGDFCFILVPRDLWNGMPDNLTGKPYWISCLHSSVPYSHGELRRFIFRFDAQTFNGII